MTDVSGWPALYRLRRFSDATRRAPDEARCEMCGAEIAAEHGHLVNLSSRSLLCVCRPCYLLFTHAGSGGSSFRAVPARYELLPGAAVEGSCWDALHLPTGLAFFFRNSATGRITAFYPSPGGATESELPLEAWGELERSLPALRTLAADVEALLVRRATAAAGRADDPRSDALTAAIVPIDICYELVGRIRRSWRGFQGGHELWQDVDAFFTRIAGRAAGTASA